MKTMIKENPAIHVAKILLKQAEVADGRLSSCDIARACGLTNITVDSLEKKISKVERSCGVIITPEYTRLGCNGGKTMIHLNISVDDLYQSFFGKQDKTFVLLTNMKLTIFFLLFSLILP